ncbi:MAG: branched-chain-amino-acid transaminase [bacterium]
MSDNRYTWVNGKLTTKEEAAISPFDHGLLYGDGCFEGIRIYNHRIFKLEEHLDRIYASAKVMQIDISKRISRADLTQALFDSVNKNEIYDKGYIRLVVTRGAGDLGINPHKCKEAPTVVIIVDTLTIYPPEDYEKGIPVIICNTRKLNRTGYQAQVKSLNYLNNIYAILEVNRVGAKEGIMLSDEGYVTEATVDNIFVIKDGVAKTPPCHVGALDGVTRSTVMDLCREHGQPVEDALMTAYDLYTADEVFLTGTGAELIPVTTIDNIVIGQGNAGPITKKILGWFRAYAPNAGTPIPPPAGAAATNGTATASKSVGTPA